MTILPSWEWWLASRAWVALLRKATTPPSMPPPFAQVVKFKEWKGLNMWMAAVYLPESHPRQNSDIDSRFLSPEFRHVLSSAPSMHNPSIGTTPPLRLHTHARACPGAHRHTGELEVVRLRHRDIGRMNGVMLGPVSRIFRGCKLEPARRLGICPERVISS